MLRHAVAANAYAFVLVTTPTRSQHHTAHPGPLPLSSKIIDHHHRLQRRSRSPTLFSFIGGFLYLYGLPKGNNEVPGWKPSSNQDSSHERGP